MVGGECIVFGTGAAHRFAGEAVQRFISLVDHTAWAVPGGRRVADDVVCIEKLRLAAAGASYPLPTEVVAGEITVEQVTVKPVCRNPPVHLTNMHDVAGQPHTGMVMQIARGVQGAHRHIDNRHTCSGLSNIGRQ